MGMLDPEDNARNHPEGAVALAALVIAGGQAAELLAAGDQVLDAMAQPVERPIEGAGPALVGLARDGDPGPSTTTRLANGAAAVAFVAGHAPGALAGSPAAGAPDRAPGQQPVEHRRLVRLARGQHQGQRLA